MARQIYTVTAWIVDANGTKSVLSGYPKDFDSKNYADAENPLPEGNVAKALKRAQGDFSEVWGAFCKRDDRLVQTVTLHQVNGLQIDQKSMGAIVEEETGGEE